MVEPLSGTRPAAVTRPAGGTGVVVMDERIGARLGRYEITDLVGAGGMATVYRALDPALDRLVAIKLLHPHLAQDPAFVGRFRHEARAVAALRHPNIVRVFDFGIDGSDYYMVMEYIEGGTLAALLREAKDQGATLAPQQVLRLVCPLCSAMAYAAGEGMTHRDIKPSNIMLTNAGDPILTDYGIAKIVGATSYTASGTVMGSAHYMAPEQIQGLDTDVRADIYSMGVVIFEALTGRVPFNADTTASILAQHVSAPTPSLASVKPDLPRTLQDVIDKALAKDPSARFQTPEELAADLSAALARSSETEIAHSAVTGGSTVDGVDVVRKHGPGTTRMDSYVYPSPGWEPPPSLSVVQRLRKRWALLAAGVLALVAVVVAASVLGTRDGESTSPPTAAPLESSVSSIISSVMTAPFMTTSTSTPVTDVSPQTAGLRAEADILRMAGKFKEAVAKYTEALQLDPKDGAARTGLGITYYHLPKAPQMGSQQLEAAGALDPGNVQAWAYLGACRYLAVLFADGLDYTAALDACNKALELDPNSALAHAFSGQIHAVTKRGDEALAEASRAVSLAPSDPEVLISMGDVKSELGDWEGAVPYYKRALTLAPNYPHYVLALATAYRETGDYDTSLEYFRSALQLDQGYEYALPRDRDHDVGQGRPRGGETNLRQAIALDDTDAFAHWALGGVYYEQVDSATALPELERAVALRPENAGFLEWVGACYMALEMWEEARAALEKAARLDPSRQGVQDLLEQLEAEGH